MPDVTHAISFPDRKTLTRGDRVVVRAIAEAMFSQDGEVTTSHIDAHLEEVDAFVSAASKPLRFGLRLALLVVRLAPLLMLFRMRPLEQLTIDQRVEILSRLERSRLTTLSLAFIGWRSVMTLVFYEDPTELKALGYTTDRHRHRRHLAVMPVQVSPTHVMPAPLESGVRIKDPDSERDGALSLDAPAGSSREVA